MVPHEVEGNVNEPGLLEVFRADIYHPEPLHSSQSSRRGSVFGTSRKSSVQGVPKVIGLSMRGHYVLPISEE